MHGRCAFDWLKGANVKTLTVTMAPRADSYRRLELVMDDNTTTAEVCAFALKYASPPDFIVSQRIAQSLMKHFAAVHDGYHETMGVA